MQAAVFDMSQPHGGDAGVRVSMRTVPKPVIHDGLPAGTVVVRMLAVALCGSDGHCCTHPRNIDEYEEGDLG